MRTENLRMQQGIEGRIRRKPKPKQSNYKQNKQTSKDKYQVKTRLSSN